MQVYKDDSGTKIKSLQISYYPEGSTANITLIVSKNCSDWNVKSCKCDSKSTKYPCP